MGWRFHVVGSSYPSPVRANTAFQFVMLLVVFVPVLFPDTSFQEFVNSPCMTEIKERSCFIHIDVPGHDEKAEKLPDRWGGWGCTVKVGEYGKKILLTVMKIWAVVDCQVYNIEICQEVIRACPCITRGHSGCHWRGRMKSAKWNWICFGIQKILFLYR